MSGKVVPNVGSPDGGSNPLTQAPIESPYQAPSILPDGSSHDLDSAPTKRE